MRLAGPLRIVALIIVMGLTWILVTILLGGPGVGLPRIQQFFTSPENSVTAGKSPVPSLFPPVPAFHTAFCCQPDPLGFPFSIWRLPTSFHRFLGCEPSK